MMSRLEALAMIAGLSAEALDAFAIVAETADAPGDCAWDGEDAEDDITAAPPRSTI